MAKAKSLLPVESSDATFNINCDTLYYSELIGAHIQETWELDFIKRGYGVHVFNNTTEPCREGEVILIPPKTIHNWIIDPKSLDNEGRIEYFTLTFNPRIFSNGLSAFPEIESCIAFFKDILNPMEICGECGEAVKKLLIEMSREEEVFRLPIFIKILITIARGTHKRYIDTAQAPTKVPKAINIVQKAYQYILNNYNRHITLDEVADAVAMNKSAFCSLFKKNYTQSFFYVLNEHRIQVACILLCEVPLRDIADIGYSVGFNDISYFHRTFKRYKGCSPRQYRQKVKEFQKV